VPSIAVLPFADMSPQKDQEYFSDGLAEEILNALTQIEGLHVAGRTSSFSFKGRTEGVGTIAAKLHVTSLLEGSVRKAGGRVRITAQLVDTANGYHLWSQTYDRELGDVFAVQDDIARSVVEALRVKLLPAAAGASPRAPRRTASAAAYEQYLIGLDLRRRLSPDSWRRAIVAFERAVGLDPDYAAAWAELANAQYWRANELTRGAEVDDGKRRAAEAAERGVALDPGLAEAYAVRGMVRAFARRWSAAKEDLDRALALNPGSADVRWNRASAVLLPLGKVDEAIADFRRAAELDPLWPQAWGGLGEALVARGDTEEARAMYRRAAELAPAADIPRHGIVVTLLAEGRAREAVPLLARPASAWQMMDEALVFHALGDAPRAREALDRLVAEAGEAGAFQIAEVHAWCGDVDAAFAWLDRAFAQRDAGVTELRVSPFLRRVAGDARFAAALRRLDQPVD
jgi:serine/threonine-protein kinase